MTEKITDDIFINSEHSKVQTVSALEASILKWELVVREGRSGMRNDDCALCQLFYHQKIPCEGCPIRNTSGQAFCRGTPFVDYSDAIMSSEFHDLSLDPLIQSAAQAELNFLKSLRPKEDA